MRPLASRDCRPQDEPGVRFLKALEFLFTSAARAANSMMNEFIACDLTSMNVSSLYYKLIEDRRNKMINKILKRGQPRLMNTSRCNASQFQQCQAQQMHNNHPQHPLLLARLVDDLLPQLLCQHFPQLNRGLVARDSLAVYDSLSRSR